MLDPRFPVRRFLLALAVCLLAVPGFAQAPETRPASRPAVYDTLDKVVDLVTYMSAPNSVVVVVKSEKDFHESQVDSVRFDDEKKDRLRTEFVAEYNRVVALFKEGAPFQDRLNEFLAAAALFAEARPEDIVAYALRHGAKIATMPGYYFLHGTPYTLRIHFGDRRTSLRIEGGVLVYCGTTEDAPARMKINSQLVDAYGDVVDQTVGELDTGEIVHGSAWYLRRVTELKIPPEGPALATAPDGFTPAEDPDRYSFSFRILKTAPKRRP